MISEVSLSQRLKAHTADAHERIEGALYGGRLMNGTITQEEYIHLLRTHHSFHWALEQAREEQQEAFVPLKLAERRKAHLIAEDLRQLGIPVPVPKRHFAGMNAPKLLGAMYVAEGSTLGGAVIGRALQKHPSLWTSISPLHFFGAYGDQIGMKWKEFRAFLDASPVADRDHVLEGAQEAFELYGKIFATLNGSGHTSALSSQA